MSNFKFFIELYERVLDREDLRQNTYDHKSSNLVAFLGATVVIFISVFIPNLFDVKYVGQMILNQNVAFLWSFSLLFSLFSVFAFFKVIWHWRKILSPMPYMYPAPSTYDVSEDLTETQEEYLIDLEKSIKNNQKHINSLGTEFIKMVFAAGVLAIFVLISIILFVISKLILI